MTLLVTPPSWRPDLTDPADLAEEVIRLEGYQNIPVRAVRATGGRGLTSRQRLRRATSRALADHGLVEVLSWPFTSAADFDRLQLAADDARRRAVRLANPLSDDEPLMRTTLLPGLLRTLARNLGRGFTDVLLYEFGLVFRPRPDAAPTAPILRVDRGPAVHELAQLEAALPDQPLRVGAVLAGNAEPAGYWGPGRPAGWQDAIEAARVICVPAWCRSTSGPTSTSPGILAAARRSSSRTRRATNGWPGTRANCTRASSPPSACRPGRRRWSWTCR